jgi:hypothetical protein
MRRYECDRPHGKPVRGSRMVTPRHCASQQGSKPAEAICCCRRRRSHGRSHGVKTINALRHPLASKTHRRRQQLGQSAAKSTRMGPAAENWADVAPEGRERPHGWGANPCKGPGRSVKPFPWPGASPGRSTWLPARHSGRHRRPRTGAQEPAPCIRNPNTPGTGALGLAPPAVPARTVTTTPAGWFGTFNHRRRARPRWSGRPPGKSTVPWRQSAGRPRPGGRLHSRDGCPTNGTAHRAKRFMYIR